MAEKKDRYVAYVGTYTHSNSVGIHVYDIDPDTGKMVEKSVAPINNPSYLKVSDDGRRVYSIADEGVASFRILEDGSLEFLTHQWIGGMRGCYVETDKQRRYLFVAGYHDGRVTMMRMGESGELTGIADGIFHQGLGISSVEKRLEPKVTCVDLTPEEDFLCAVDYGLDQIKIYRVHYDRGRLELVDILRFPYESQPRMLRFSKDGRFAYVMCERSNEIYVYEYKYNKKMPEFEKIQVVSTVGKGAYVLAASSMICFDSTEEHMYVSIDAKNCVACMNRDPETGMLERSFEFHISGDYPKTIMMMPGDKFIVVLNHDTNEIRTFEVDLEKKCALMRSAPVSVDKPNCIQIHKLPN